ncbi:hypothetical protein MHD_06780 [Mannheimia granulomatis]|uniref:Phage holin family protein n=1 Tax=Mannheimia granulomatis TaxID=85402 RepID=A0A011NE38_9PAST|nr:phage holin family protein [Mannheimia granulomatis]EXI62822.1 hypothetical protein AK33_03510 [Mannheimia granulomatis]RGE48180.1 hypothetical protein MHD_06780 [Mannheimia granulomatis]
MLDNIKSGFRNSIITLLEIAQVRGEMARLEISEQKNQLVSVLIFVLLGFIFLLVSFISLLFGLDNYLLPDQKIKVFFAISIVTFIAVVICGVMILSSLKKQRNFMQSTLTELKLDIAAFKNALTLKQNGEH